MDIAISGAFGQILNLSRLSTSKRSEKYKVIDEAKPWKHSAQIKIWTLDFSKFNWLYKRTSDFILNLYYLENYLSRFSTSGENTVEK